MNYRPQRFINLIFVLFIVLIIYAALGPFKSEYENNKLVCPSVFEVIVEDVAGMPPINPSFVGDKVLITNKFNDGDSLYYNLDKELGIDEELVTSLKLAAEEDTCFPNPDQFGHFAVITQDRPSNYLEYFREDAKNVQGKCFISFWRPGYSRDRKCSIVRLKYGPDSHTIVITFLLRKNERNCWEIFRKNVDGYP